MSTDNKRQLVLFDVTGLPTENVPRELRCFSTLSAPPLNGGVPKANGPVPNEM